MNTKLVQSLIQIIDSLSESERNLLYERLSLQPQPSEHISLPLQDESFIGMWKNREDMQDSSQWVRRIRQQEWLS